MKVQRIINPQTGKDSWLLLGADFLPVQPVLEYFRYLENTRKSPATIRTCAYHLKYYWTFLEQREVDWKDVDILMISDFVAWLRTPVRDGSIAMIQVGSPLVEASINGIIGAVSSFYEFSKLKGVAGKYITLLTSRMAPGRRYKGFLHHLNQSKTTRTRLIKLKVQ